MNARSRHESGQAAVESAIVLPLVVFLMLGTLQLFIMLQARIMTEYAAYRATRAGSVNHGSCEAMNHAAIAALLPTFARTDTPALLGSAFAARKDNDFGPTTLTNGEDLGGEQIVWIFRERPLPGDWAGQDDELFDYRWAPMNLEIRMVFWFPLRIPFADWVISRMMLAHYGFQTMTGVIDPLSPARTADWPNGLGATYPGGDLTGYAQAMVVGRYQTLASAGKYVFPIQATHAMRMMTPAKRVNWNGGQNCF